jgi:hydroxyacylglutathione hydrolase
MAAKLHESVQRLLRLPPELEIYPGHQAGSACGAGISGKPASTLAFERRFNPTLALPVQDFVDALVADIPPPPAQMQSIVQRNLGFVQ